LKLLFDKLKKKRKTARQIALISFMISRFGYRPKKIELFELSVRHGSMPNAIVEGSYERLEFLGDSVISTVVADFLYCNTATEDEGYLTRARSRLTSRKMHSEIATTMELEKVMQYQKKGNINVSTVVGNAFEAVIGAIFLDAGYEKTKKILLHHVYRKYININQIIKDDLDFKSRLIIWCQQYKITLKFVDISENVDVTPTQYHVKVLLNGKQYGEGKGQTRKEAQQLAAKRALVSVEK